MINLKNISDYDFPRGLHNRVMKKIYFLKFRQPLLFIISLSCLNLINSGWHFINKASEMQTFAIFQTMAQHSELSIDYLQSFCQTMLENTPVNLFLVFMINLVLVYYLMNIFKHFQRSNQTL